MKVIILAGGLGTRLGKVTKKIPKPMVPIGGKPIMWHIMKHYFDYGFSEFILCLGYKAEYIKTYFIKEQTNINSFLYNCTIDLVDTGVDTLKGGRLKRIEDYVTADVNLLTYGDGLSNVNLRDLVDFHLDHKGMVTVTGVHPPSRFGELEIQGSLVKSFVEKPQLSRGIINGGFMAFNKDLFSHLSKDKSSDFEHGPLEKLSQNNEVYVFKHLGFWQCMDNEREWDYLDKEARKENLEWGK